MKKTFFIITLAIVLTACGQTGKLYLPEKNTDSTVKP